MKRILSLIIITNILFSICPVSYAAEKNSIITDNVVEITETISDNGFVHPGIGFTAETLNTMRDMVKNGVSPWADYFEGMRRTRYADLNGKLKKQEQIVNNGGISSFADDAQRAWVQAILYFVTGNEEYRKIPVEAIKFYSEREDFFPAWFSDSHIKLGKYVRTFCEMAELMRYTTPQDESLAVTDEMIKKLDENCLKPMSDKCLSTKTYFMNQHNYSLLGYMAETVLADDYERYADAVEMTTVNSGNTENEARNGAIASVVRWVTADEETGEACEPHYQLAEMGRDQDHAKGNIDNYVLLARTTDAQKTKVDPVSGQITTADNGVSVTKFRDDSIIRGGELYFEYNLGYSLPWTTIYSENNHSTKIAVYRGISTGYHGRIMSTGTMAMYYRYKALGYDLENDYPMLNYAAQQVKESSRDNVLTGTYIDTTHNYDFDFWTDLPASAADSAPDTKRAAEILATELSPYESTPSNIIEIEDRFIDLNVNGEFAQMDYPHNASDVPIEKMDGYAHMQLKGNDARTMVLYNADMPKNKIGLFVRTTDVVELKLYSSNDYAGGEILTITIPDTDNEWKYVIFDFSEGSVREPDRQAIWYIAAKSVSGKDAVIDFDKVNTSETEINPIELDFNDGETVSLLKGENYTRSIAVDGAKTYRIECDLDIPVDNGIISWTPQESGEFEAYITASNDTTVNTKKLVFKVCDTVEDVKKSILSGYDENVVYTSETDTAMKRAANDVDGSRESFDALQNTVNSLELLNPSLRYGGLDYSNIVTCSSGSAVENLVDNSANTNITLNEPDMNITLDFGCDYKVKADSFEIQPSDGFPARVLKSDVYGSDNGTDWVKLTSNSAEINDRMQTLYVSDEQKQTAYRYLRIYMPNGTNRINENAWIMGVAEFRINGERIEEYTPDYHKVLIYGYDDGTFRPNDNISRAEAAVMLSRTHRAYMDNNECVNTFGDVADDAWYTSDLAYMAKKKFIVADAEGSFRPDDKITRGEVCDFVVRLKGLKGDAVCNFSDVSGHTYEKQVALVSKQGWIAGYGDNTFNPDGYITRAEFAAIVSQMEGRSDIGTECNYSDVSEEHWAVNFIAELSKAHYTE